MNFSKLKTTVVTGFLASALAISGVAAHHDDDHDHDDHDNGTPAATPDATPENGGTGVGAGYMMIENTGDEDDTLVSANTDVAELVEIHAMEIEDDTMVMEMMEDGLDVPAGEEVLLDPGGYHLMFINLTQDLEMDETFEVTLTFEQAGEVDLTFTIGTGAPEDAATVTVGDIEIEGAWSRPAPMIGGGDDDHDHHHDHDHDDDDHDHDDHDHDDEEDDDEGDDS